MHKYCTKLFLVVISKNIHQNHMLDYYLFLLQMNKIKVQRGWTSCPRLFSCETLGFLPYHSQRMPSMIPYSKHEATFSLFYHFDKCLLEKLQIIPSEGYRVSGFCWSACGFGTGKEGRLSSSGPRHSSFSSIWETSFL